MLATVFGVVLAIFRIVSLGSTGDYRQEQSRPWGKVAQNRKQDCKFRRIEVANMAARGPQRHDAPPRDQRSLCEQADMATSRHAISLMGTPPREVEGAKAPAAHSPFP